jgi:hypothetical protein
VYNAYAVSASTLAIARRELPAYHGEKSAVSGKERRVLATKGSRNNNLDKAAAGIP